MNVALIVNPTAGRRNPEATPERIAARLRELGIASAVHCTRKRGDAEYIAREAAACGVERVLVAGGDGTLNEVANGLLGSQVSVGIIPCGTANVLAAELGLPLDISDACFVATRGSTRPIDLGICNGRAFFLAAGIGFDAAVIRAISPRIKRWTGTGAYWLAGIRQLLMARAATYRMQIDGEPRRASLYGVIACNTRNYAGRRSVVPAARSDDGMLDLALIRARTRVELAQTAIAILRGRASACPHLETLRIRSLECETDPALPVQLDGDDLGDTPAGITIRPAAFRVAART